MTKKIITIIAALLCGCVTQPPMEALKVKLHGDRSVEKMRIIAERAINREADGNAGEVWVIWDETVEKAKALEPVGFVPADFMISITKKRDAKLRIIEENRLAELRQVATLHKNQIDSSNGIYDAWAEQGKANADMMREVSEFALEARAVYDQYKEKKSIEKKAEEAAKEAESKEEEK